MSGIRLDRQEKLRRKCLRGRRSTEVSGEALLYEQPVAHVVMRRGKAVFQRQEPMLHATYVRRSAQVGMNAAAWVRQEFRWGTQERTELRKRNKARKQAKTVDAQKDGPADPPAWAKSGRLVVSQFPYSTGWVEVRPFRTYRKKDAKGEDVRARDLREARLRKEEDLKRFVEAAPYESKSPEESFGRNFPDYDFFTEDEPLRVASLPDFLWPARAAGAGIDGRRKSTQALRSDASRTYGVVDDYKAALDSVVNSEKLQKLVRDLTTPEPEGKKKSERQRQKAESIPARPGTGTQFAQLSQEALDRANELCLLAAQQALAGPVDPAGRAKPYRLVEDFAFDILQRHLQNADRTWRAREAPKRQPPASADRAGSPLAWPTEDDCVGREPSAASAEKPVWIDEVPNVMGRLGGAMTAARSPEDVRAFALALAAYARRVAAVRHPSAEQALRAGRAALSRVPGFAECRSDFEAALSDLT